MQEPKAHGNRKFTPEVSFKEAPLNSNNEVNGQEIESQDPSTKIDRFEKIFFDLTDELREIRKLVINLLDKNS